MELYQLRTFVTVARHGHLTKAAEALHLSQPAVTAQIKALEEEWGSPLFARTSTGVVLTAAGKVLLPDAEQLLQAAHLLRSKARQLCHETAVTLRIGVPLPPAQLQLGLLLQQLRQQQPLLEIQVKQLPAGLILNQVRKKELECGFYLGENPYSSLHVLPLASIAMSVIAPADTLQHSWGQLRDVPADRWIGYGPFSGYDMLLQQCCRQHNLTPHPRLEVDHEAAALELVMAGEGVALVQHALAEQAAQAGQVRLLKAQATEAPLQFIYPAELEHSPLNIRLCHILRQHWPPSA